MATLRAGPLKGRGAVSNPEGRFESCSALPVDDGWPLDEEPLPKFETIVRAVQAKSIISRNTSPDIGFDQSINPYQGCEHGCIFTYVS